MCAIHSRPPPCTATLPAEPLSNPLGGGGGGAGLMVGPALLGWIADMTSVQTALQVNAAVLVLAVTYFGVAARETKHLRVRRAAAAAAAAAAA